MQLALFQGVAKKHRAAVTVEMKASDNPVLQNIQADPTLISTAFKKNRFYMVGLYFPVELAPHPTLKTIEWLPLIINCLYHALNQEELKIMLVCPSTSSLSLFFFSFILQVPQHLSLS